jgi:hypothetical protein
MNINFEYFFSSQTLIPQVMYADSTIHEDDDLIDSEINPNRPLIDYTSDCNENVSI